MLNPYKFLQKSLLATVLTIVLCLGSVFNFAPTAWAHTLDTNYAFDLMQSNLKFTSTFGTFPSAFYQGYNLEWELEPGYNQRKELYNLYHLLNHFNLFGGSYESSANGTIDRLLSHRSSS